MQNKWQALYVLQSIIVLFAGHASIMQLCACRQRLLTVYSMPGPGCESP